MIDKRVGFSNSTQPVLLLTVCIMLLFQLFKIFRLHNRQNSKYGSIFVVLLREFVQ